MFHRVLSSSSSTLDSSVNKNVNWVGHRFYVFYVFCLVVGSYLVNVLLVGRILTPTQGWTLIHTVHGIINFLVMHWLTGTPAELMQQNDDTDRLGWWEQLDNGEAWTTNRRNLMILPLVLFLVTSHFTDYDVNHLSINLAVLALVLIPKLPQLHRVRLGSATEEDLDNIKTD